MQSMKDQLLKARLVDKKHVRKVEHEERERRKKLGREAIEQEKTLLKKELEEKERRRKEEQQHLNRLRKEEEAARGGVQRMRSLVLGSSLLKHGFGTEPFHFVASNGSLPCLEVSREMAARLETGKAAVVELPGERFPEFHVVPADVAEQVRRAAPDAVRFWNRDQDR
jgi:uncharacterized protein YaiL (DUF2058 family)